MPSKVMMCIIVLKFHIQNWHWTEEKPRERCILSKENLDIGICLATSLMGSLCVLAVQWVMSRSSLQITVKLFKLQI